MATRVLLTIDTELVWRHHAAGLDWRQNLARSFDAAGVGVPYQLALLAEHGLKACFFVDPMPALVHGLEPIKRMVEPILAAGQEVQLHLHPFWADLAGAERDGTCPELNAFDRAEQLALVTRARDLLIAAGAPAPIAFRAGSYAADAATLAVLAQLGFRFDSSHNGTYHPSMSRVPLDPRQVTPIEAEGVIEVPVGQLEERPGKLRHLQICAVSATEMERALAHASREQHPAVAIVSHSFELATRDGLAVNEVVRRRFVRLCRLLGERGEQYPTAWFSDLDALPLARPGRPAASGVAPRLRRMAGQAWGNARYERRRANGRAAHAG